MAQINNVMRIFLLISFVLTYAVAESTTTSPNLVKRSIVGDIINLLFGFSNSEVSSSSPVGIIHHALYNDDHDELIDIFLRKNLYSRQIIADKYLHAYGQTLKADMRSRLFGNFRNLMAVLAADEFEYYAEEINDSIFGYTNMSAVRDILTNHDRSFLTALKRTYRSKYHSDITTDLKNLPLGFLYELNTPLLDDLTTSKDIDDLDLDSRWSYFNYRPIYREYIIDRNEYFAKRLYSCLLLNDYRGFARIIIITLNENKLSQITEIFQDLHNESLKTAIYRFSDKYYRRAIEAIIDTATNSYYYKDNFKLWNI